MPLKQRIIQICNRACEDATNWKFQSQFFKNGSLKYAVKLVIPLWSFSPGTALMSPAVGIYIPKVERLYMSILKKKNSYWTHSVCLRKHYPGYEGSGIRFYERGLVAAPGKIQLVLKRGIELLEKTYDFSSEEALLKSIPEDVEEVDGVKYCLVRACLGDIDYVRRYREDEIKTVRRKKYDQIDKILEYFEKSI